MRYHMLGAIAVPEDVWWSDEFEWSQIEQTTERSLTGALIIQQGVKQSGRPITLTSNPRGGWVTRSVVLALQAQRDAGDPLLALALADGREFAVIHDCTRPFEASPVRPVSDLSTTSNYLVSIPLMQV